MNKSELVASVAEVAELTKKDAEKAVNAVFASVQKALVEDDKVQIIGFGTFEVRTRAARKGRNPQTGETIEIPASKNPVFKAGKALKEAVKSQVLTLRYIEGILINWAQNGVKERYIDEKPQERKVKESHYHWWEDE